MSKKNKNKNPFPKVSAHYSPAIADAPNTSHDDEGVHTMSNNAARHHNNQHKKDHHSHSQETVNSNEKQQDNGNKNIFKFNDPASHAWGNILQSPMLAAFQQQSINSANEAMQEWMQSSEYTTENLHNTLLAAQGTLDAIIASSQAAVKATEDSNTQFAELNNSLLANQLEASRDFLQCRNLDDVLDVQTRVFKNNMELLFNGLANFYELSMQSSKTISAPLQEQATVLSDKISHSFSMSCQGRK